LRLLSLMPPIVSTTWPTTLPPCAATLEASRASSSACRALSALRRTVTSSCVIDEAVACSVLACCSVRLLRSRLPCAISALACATLSLLWRIGAQRTHQAARDQHRQRHGHTDGRRPAWQSAARLRAVA
jgi:hypothetical protein